MKKLLVLGLIALGAAVSHAAPALGPVKYVFLFIGDGMSWPQRRATDEYLKATKRGRLFSDTFPYSVSTVTRCFIPAGKGDYPTDSAASGTAIACGAKTKSGRLGIDPDGNRLESVAEVAHRNGVKVGIVTTCGSNHATPAAFYAHVPKRKMYDDIAVQLAESGFDLFAGAPLLVSDSAPDKDAAAHAARQTCRAKGYTIFKNIKDRAGLDPIRPGGKTLVTARIPRTADRAAGDLALPDLVAKGIETLDGPAGFFMMVEGSMIDWGCHGNDLYATVEETAEFDAAVRVAGEFAARHPADTLIVVTGDHETGGLTLLSGKDGPNPAAGLLARQKGSNSAFANRVNAMRKGTRTDFADGRKEITAFYGLVFPGEETAATDPRLVLTADEVKELELSFHRAMGNKEVEKTFFDNSKDAKAYGKKDPGLAWLCGAALARRAGYKWTTRGHSALHQQTSAFGPMAAAFAAPRELPARDRIRQKEQTACGFNVPDAVIDNTDIGRRLKLCVAR